MHYFLPHPWIQKTIYNMYLVNKNFQSRNPYRIFVAVLENQCLHKFILSLSYLQLANFEVKSHSVPVLAIGGFIPFQNVVGQSSSSFRIPHFIWILSLYKYVEKRIIGLAPSFPQIFSSGQFFLLVFPPRAGNAGNVLLTGRNRQNQFYQ